VISLNLSIEGLIFHEFLQAGLHCPETVSVNCTSLTKSTDIFSKILGNYESGKKANGSFSPLQQLQRLFSQKQQQSRSKMM
jgi:cell division control protein 6